MFRRRTSLAFLTLFVLTWRYPAGLALAQDGPGPEASLAEGRRLLEAGEATAAEALYRRLAAAYPNLADAYEGLAAALEARGEAREAAAVLLHVGGGFLAGGEYREAISYLERSVRLAPEAAPIHVLLGRALLLDQAFRRGEEHLARAVELGDRSGATLTFLGAARWENGKLAEAETVLRQAIGAGAGVAARQRLGRLLLAQGRAAEALDVLASLRGSGLPGAGMDPGLALDVELDLARALADVGRWEEALASCRRAVAIAPDLSQGHYRLGLLLLRLGRREEAREAMETYRRLYEEELERTRQQGLERARLDRAWELLRQGEAEEAAGLFAALPGTGETLRGLALAHSLAGHHGEAIRALEQAVVLEPESGELRLMLTQEQLALDAARGDEAPGEEGPH